MVYINLFFLTNKSVIVGGAKYVMQVVDNLMDYGYLLPPPPRSPRPPHASPTDPPPPPPPHPPKNDILQ